MGGLAQIGGVLATVVRGVWIWMVALVCVARYAVGACRRLAIRDRAARAEHRAHQRGALLRWSFTELGATFVKIGQVMSTRGDLLAPGTIAELRELQDHVPAFPFARARAIVERELRAPLGERFRSFEPAPIAAGSIAQVHRAVLATGDEVAVKIVRPGVRTRVRRDARILLWLAHAAHAVSPRARAADVIGHTRTIIAGILGQLDLRREADNYDRFRADFAGAAGLAFPAVHRDASTAHVLTMELVHGVHLERIPAHHVAQVTQVLRRTFFAMCFEHGLVHADLHPGNILVREDGTVVVLDVGLVKDLSCATVEEIVDVARCLVIGTAADLVRHLQKHHRYLPSTNWDAVIEDAQAFVASLRTRCIAEIEVSVLVSRLFALARKHRIRPMPELALVLVGLVTIEGIAKRLDPDANMMAEVAAYLGRRMAGPRGLATGSFQWIPTITDAPMPAPRPEPAPSAPALPRARTVTLASPGTGRAPARTAPSPACPPRWAAGTARLRRAPSRTRRVLVRPTRSRWPSRAPHPR